MLTIASHKDGIACSMGPDLPNMGEVNGRARNMKSSTKHIKGHLFLSCSSDVKMDSALQQLIGLLT